jgi:hypothetical protein
MTAIGTLHTDLVIIDRDVADRAALEAWLADGATDTRLLVIDHTTPQALLATLTTELQALGRP